MKFIPVLISVLFFIGVIHAFLDEVFENHKAKTLKRVARSAFNQLGLPELPNIEAMIIANCEVPGGVLDIADDLGATFDEFKMCIPSKKIFLISKEEFLSEIDSCAEESVKKATECLPEEMKYYPKILLDLAKAGVSFAYDNMQILKTELTPCLSKINSYRVQRNHLTCVIKVSRHHHDSDKIPGSASSFCSKLLSVNGCFSDMLREYCDDFEEIKTVRENYVMIFKNVCDVASADPAANLNKNDSLTDLFVYN